MQQSLIAFGLSTEHLVSIAPDLRAERETASAFKTLGRRTAERGFELRVASAFRDYDRQVRIINDKWTGARPVTDGEGRLLERTRYTDDDWLNLILRFSALPGTSRHHWGTDLDIWDVSAVGADYRPLLSPSEYDPSGPFFEMTCLAASSLPVPVSPTISNVESVRATRPIVSSRPRIFAHASLWK